MKWKALLFLFVFFGTVLMAQDEVIDPPETLPPSFLFSTNLQLSVPIGAFDRNLASRDVGLNAAALFRVSTRLPIYLGADVSVIQYDQANITFFELIDGYPVEFKEEIL
ncbi:MAG: hypothetical protein AAFO94_16110, partial [Bacteroidota bacterium]